MSADQTNNIAESTITLLVVDDHDLLREGVSACLSGFDDLEVIEQARSGAEAVSLAAELNPDVVIIDLVMPGLSGTDAIEQLRTASPTMGIVALSSFSDPDRIRLAIEAGANGYLVKSIDAGSLAAAVRSAAKGESSFSPEVTLALTAPRRRDPLVALTTRELEVAGLVAEGRTNAEIAVKLSLSIFTIKNHVSSVLMKLGVQSRTEAASLIFRAQGNP